MSCGHGCGHGHSLSHDREWCFREDWSDDPRVGRRELTRSRVDDAPAVDALEMRFASLQWAIQRLEIELAALRTSGESRPPSHSATTES
jgi:hypothetical protein